jgi:hypothetical protein
VLGTDSLYAYLEKYGIVLDPQFSAMIGVCEFCSALLCSSWFLADYPQTPKEGVA